MTKDINMPIKNGFDCLAEIRSREDALKEVKIIIQNIFRALLDYAFLMLSSCAFLAVRWKLSLQVVRLS